MLLKTRSVRALARTLALALMLALLVVPANACALELREVWTGVDGNEMPTSPNGAYNVALVFDGNVSFVSSESDDASFVEENLSKVYVLNARGERAGSFAAKGASSQDEQKVIYLASSEWLEPVSEYTVVAQAGIRSARGEVTRTEYRSIIQTTSQTPFGCSIYQLWGIMISGSALFVGILVALVRALGSRRRRHA